MSELDIIPFREDTTEPAGPRRLTLLAVACVMLLVVAGIGVQAARTGIAAATGDTLADRLGTATGRPVTAADVIATGLAGDEELVALRREPNEIEGPLSGKAVEIWATTGGGRFRQVTDYLSYDFGCVTDDPVCAELQRAGAGLGLFLLRDRPDGRSFLLVQAPAGRAVEVGGQPIGEAPDGRVVEVQRGTPPPVTVLLPDGRRYRLPEVPGAILSG